MTPRERLLTVLSGDIPDRVPVSFFVQEEFLAWYYPQKSAVRRLEEAVECANELDFDLMVRSKEFEHPHFLKKSFPGWELKKSEKISGDILHVLFEIHTPKGVLFQEEVGPYTGRSTGGIHRSIKSYLIKSVDDFEIFTEFVPAPDAETVTHMREYAEYAKKIIGDRGIFMPWGYTGAYNQASALRNVQDLMMDAYTDPDFYEAYMEKITSVIITYNSLLAETCADGIGIQGNIANAGMVGKDFFDAYILPYEKRIASRIRSLGKHTVYHNCGKASVLLESYADMGITAWETIAPPPQGDTNIKEAKSRVGDRLVLIGNIDQVDFLKNASVKEIEEATESIVLAGKPGGKYIFAASDFLETGTPAENVRAAVNAAKRAGPYR